MRIGMIGLGRMGANMVRRLIKAGHECVAYDPKPEAVQVAVGYGAQGVTSLADLARALQPPRAVWIMVPAAIVDSVLQQLRPHLCAGDVLIDGGNSNYHDDIRHSDELKPAGIHYLDIGTSGGVLGFEDGYCLMVGGDKVAVDLVEPVLASLAPGGKMPLGGGGAANAAAAAMGYLHCGPSGAGHFVKMIHNGIEYGLMAAYAEGLNLLAHADAGMQQGSADAETAPLTNPRYFQYQLDVAAITEVWRHGSIISSRLLDLTAAALAKDPRLAGFAGRVSDSGEGRWTVQAAIEVGVPAPVLSAALYSRFESRGQADFANKVLSAMRLGFGGHVEKSS
jgi:6-phosphogluconate dehydrogenase